MDLTLNVNDTAQPVTTRLRKWQSDWTNSEFHVLTTSGETVILPASMIGQMLASHQAWHAQQSGSIEPATFPYVISLNDPTAEVPSDERAASTSEVAAILRGWASAIERGDDISGTLTNFTGVYSLTFSNHSQD